MGGGSVLEGEPQFGVYVPREHSCGRTFFAGGGVGFIKSRKQCVWICVPGGTQLRWDLSVAGESFMGRTQLWGCPFWRGDLFKGGTYVSGSVFRGGTQLEWDLSISAGTLYGAGPVMRIHTFLGGGGGGEWA